MCKFLLMGWTQIICIFAKLVQPVFLCHRLSKKLKITKIWQLKVVKTKIWFVTGKSGDSGCVPEDSGSSYKSPGLDLKGGLLVFRKSQKISTASDQYVLSYVKNNYRGGGEFDLPTPAGLGLTRKNLFTVLKESTLLSRLNTWVR